MAIKRRETREITIGNKKIGGLNPILVQSMTKNDTDNIDLLREEIKNLIAKDCEIIRIAVPDKKAVSVIKVLIKEGYFNEVPVVADIQFDYTLAIEAIEVGVHCIRINPGNIGGLEKAKKIILKAKDKGICVRIGINSGSIDKKILKKFNGNIVNSMVESTLEYVRFFENCDFRNFKISAKASSVLDSISVYETISDKVNYPLHLGITEAGSIFSGSIKSSVGLGILLYEGIGDTIRVSLTGDSVYEVKAGYEILSSLGLRNFGVDIISCPTCGRTKVDLVEVVNKIESITKDIKKPLKIAIMGCIVNGPGEAREADIGIAYGIKKAAIFVKGKVIARVNAKEAVDYFKKELDNLFK